MAKSVSRTKIFPDFTQELPEHLWDKLKFIIITIITHRWDLPTGNEDVGQTNIHHHHHHHTDGTCLLGMKMWDKLTFIIITIAQMGLAHWE